MKSHGETRAGSSPAGVELFFWLNSKLEEKDKWIYYGENGWGNLVPREEIEFNEEKFINDFTYVYGDKWCAGPPSLSIFLINIKYEPGKPRFTWT